MSLEFLMAKTTD